MNKSLLALIAVTTIFLSACADPTSKSLSAEEIKTLVSEEINTKDFATKEDLKATLSEKAIATAVSKEIENLSLVSQEKAKSLIGNLIVDKSIDLGGTAFDERVAKSIEKYISDQQEAARLAQEEASKPKFVKNISADDDPVLGDPNAPVTIVEFSDYECPFCKRHYDEVWPQIKEKYVDTGKVKVVFRDFPLDFHPDAFPAAIAANCARKIGGDEKYFAFHNKLFENQKELNEDTFKKHAADLGLDAGKFDACLAKADKSEIENDIKEGTSYGIQGTPGFFINGWSLKGAYPFESFQALIEQELAK